MPRSACRLFTHQQSSQPIVYNAIQQHMNPFGLAPVGKTVRLVEVGVPALAGRPMLIDAGYAACHIRVGRYHHMDARLAVI